MSRKRRRQTLNQGSTEIEAPAMGPSPLSEEAPAPQASQPSLPKSAPLGVGGEYEELGGGIRVPVSRKE